MKQNEHAFFSKKYTIDFRGFDLLTRENDDPPLASLFSAAFPDSEPCDGIYMLNLTSGAKGMDRIVDLADELELPVIWQSQMFSGHDWSRYPQLLRMGMPVDLIASSDFGELTSRLDVIYALRVLHQSKILVIDGDETRSHAQDPATLSRIYHSATTTFGVQIVRIPVARLNAIYTTITEETAGPIADAWIQGAQQVLGPSREEIVKSAWLYHAMKRLLETEDANAITINCLGLFAKDLLPAYPCLGFMQLNDEGLLGVCEADVLSTITQLIGLFLSGSPGFVSDPVFDIPAGHLIHAHCVAARKMGGPKGNVEPYELRTHMEDDKGASVQVFLRQGEPVMCLKYTNAHHLLWSTGTIVENIDSKDDPRGCRTKIRTKVDNLETFFEHYSGGLHRVVFYGEFQRKLKLFHKFLGDPKFTLVQENRLER